MTTLKYQILEKVNYLNYYYQKQIDGIRRKRWFLIVFGLIMLIFGVFSTLGYISFLVKKPIYFDILLIGMGLALILASIWVITRKSHYFPIKNLDNLWDSELESYLKEITDYEDAVLDSGARRIAASFATLLTIIFGLTILAITIYFKTEQFELFGSKLTDEGFLIGALLIINFIVLEVAKIFGAPMTPVKYRREKEKLANKIIFSFLTDIDNSLINPLKNK